MYYGKRLLKKSIEKFAIPTEEATAVLEKAKEPHTVVISVKGVKDSAKPNAEPVPIKKPTVPVQSEVVPPAKPEVLGSQPYDKKPAATMEDNYAKTRHATTPMKSFWDKPVHKLMHPEPLKKADKFHLMAGGQRVSDEPMEMKDIEKIHGPKDKLLAAGITFEPVYDKSPIPEKLKKSDKFHLVAGGQRVSDEPMEMKDIEKVHGPKEKLLAAGITFEPVYDTSPVKKPQPLKKADKPKTQWYAQKKGCDKWHKVNDIVYSGKGFNWYHLEGHDQPLHQNEITDLATAKELNKSNVLKAGVTGLAVLASTPAQAPTLPGKPAAKVAIESHIHPADKAPPQGAMVRQHTGKDFTEFKRGDSWYSPSKVSEQLQLMKDSQYSEQYGSLLKKVNSHRKGGEKAKEGYIYP